jgi:hypothetical protein
MRTTGAGQSEGKWCILRTSGGRTIALMASLVEAGFDVWTPVQVERKRLPRGRKAHVERNVPIIPTFVFARAESIADLYRVLGMPVSPHPAFSIFRYAGRIPLVRDEEIANLRSAEERSKLAILKKQRRSIAPGTKVRTQEPAFMGLTGVVEEGDGRMAVVSFGGGFRVKIATWLLQPDRVGNDQPYSGAAALAA